MIDEAFLVQLDQVLNRLNIIETTLISIKDEIEDTQIETYFFEISIQIIGCKNFKPEIQCKF